jgi:hypothetical protein
MFLKDDARIILFNKPVRMYKGFDSLLSHVLMDLQIELASNIYVLFVNSDKDRFKMLFFDHGNITIYAMRLPSVMRIDFEKNMVFDSNSFRELIKNLKPKRKRNRYKINDN